VRNASYLAIVCGVLVVGVLGCGSSSTVSQPPPESANFADWRYTQSMMGLDAARGFGDFLAGLDPAERVKYINKSVEDGPPMRIYMLKPAYDRFAKDPNPDVSAAAKEAITKAPSTEEYEQLRKESLGR
jgi:hypothetical protein